MLKTIFETKNYRDYLRSYVHSLPQKGRGQMTKIAQALNINTSLLSQIMSGSREFSIEQALALSTFLEQTPLERDYFLLLVQKERAGTFDLRQHLQEKLDLLKTEAQNLSKRVTFQKHLSSEDQTIFYSHWLYSAVHLYCSISADGVTLEDIETRFNIKRGRAAEITQFLLRVGLCLEKKGRYLIEIQSTYLEFGSPYLVQHHSNWRLRAINKATTLTQFEMMFSGQVSISKENFQILREKLAQFLSDASEVAKHSASEDLAVLNIDWFWLE